ncbi:hypothetical protein O181_068545 [Austropuccinia psidii MF-1]|uniref:Uncharacterized protein n=1 Tax=Austropuccinia psidii MF-1 TaxID=1389203 RepID=A0A9Q3F179_9BASI|nr:hypothetical protein [Austropuccinia psidii MF-1]
MSPTRSWSNYSIQLYGPLNRNNHSKYQRKDNQHGGDAQMEDSGTPTSSQKLVSTFEPLLKFSEPDITSFALIRAAKIPSGSCEDTPVPVQQLVHGIKATRMRDSTKFVDGNHELLQPFQKLLD